MLFLEYGQWQERRQVDKEIKLLQEQETQLKEGNRQLEQSINFLSTPEYQEKLARLQLNLKKEGEVVVEFSKTANKEGNKTQGEQKTSNPVKWWNYIFIN